MESSEDKLLPFDVRDLMDTIKDIVNLTYILIRPKLIELVRVIERSEKKKEIIKMINDGVLRQSEIAKALNVDRTTVRDHIEGMNNQAIKIVGIPLIRTSRKGLKPTILFDYLNRELKNMKEKQIQTLESIITEETEGE
ncbi:MAG: helix-turn-helix domain-containing protein [Candidatus Njordarchaeia archaeon]